MIYNCIFPLNLTEEELAAVGPTGEAKLLFQSRAPLVGDVISCEGIKFKVSSIQFNLVKFPPGSLGDVPNQTNYNHDTTTVTLTKFPG